MRFFGVTVFAVLLEARTALYQNISSDFFLWAVFIFFLVIDAILLSAWERRLNGFLSEDDAIIMVSRRCGDL
ncbi:MAG: hypothetical protein ACLVJ6_13765 [Merdibacter sp.]